MKTIRQKSKAKGRAPHWDIRKNNQPSSAFFPQMASAEILHELNEAKTEAGIRRALTIAKLAVIKRAKNWGNAKKVLLQPLPPKTSVMAAVFILLCVVIGLSPSLAAVQGSVGQEKILLAALPNLNSLKSKNELAVLGERMLNLNPLGSGPGVVISYYHEPQYPVAFNVEHAGASVNPALAKTDRGEVLGARTFKGIFTNVVINPKPLSAALQLQINTAANLFLSQQQPKPSQAFNPAAISTATAAGPLKKTITQLQYGLYNEYLITQNSIAGQAEQLDLALNNINFYYLQSQKNIANGSIAMLGNYSAALGRLAFGAANPRQNILLAYGNEIASIRQQGAALAMAVQMVQQGNVGYASGQSLAVSRGAAAGQVLGAETSTPSAPACCQ